MASICKCRLFDFSMSIKYSFVLDQFDAYIMMIWFSVFKDIMQNNPFNLLSQLQTVAGANSTNSQENSGQPPWNNAALMGAMQNMLSRGNSSTVPPNLPGNALSGVGQQSWANKPPAASDSSVDLNIFRQFQLQQQSQPVQSQMNSPQRAAAVPGWNNLQGATASAAGAGTGVAAANPLMNMMVPSFMPQPMGAVQQQQPQQTNPMAGFMQVMQMMSMTGMMPNMGTQMPNMDPNMTKQLLMQLVGQLQQSGQLGTDDSVQKMLQQALCGGAQNLGNVMAPAAEVISIQPDEGEDQNTDEEIQAPGPASSKRKFKGIKAKTVEVKDASPKAKGDAGVLQKSIVITPEGRSRPSKKPSGADSEHGKKETDKKTVRTPASKSGAKGPGVRKVGPQSKLNEASKKIPELVMVDSDDDDGEITTSSIAEEAKSKKGNAGKTKTQEKQAKKSAMVVPKVSPRGSKDSGKSTVPDFPLQRIKVEDIEDESYEVHSRSPRRAKASGSEKTAEINVMPQIKLEPDVKPCIPFGVNVKQCEVRLERLKRDANGEFVVPLNLRKATAVVKSESRSSAYGEPLSVKRKDDQPPPISVQLLPNLNAVVHPQMRTIFVGHLNGNMQWLSLIGWAASRSFCQCPFCPMLTDTPKPILNHIRSDHTDLTFALAKMKPPTGKFLYLFCRHCDFVAVDVTINWLHFEVYHNVSDILEGTARPRIEDFAPAKIENRRGLEDVMDTFLSYMCYDCELINDDSKQVAIHVLYEHPNTPHYNGCFVKLLGLRKPLKSENVQYKKIISDDDFTEFRQEAFICMMCDYIAHCPYMALSHNLITHQTKRVLFECMEAGCSFNCITDAAMSQHLTSKHRLKTDLRCSTTLLEPRVDGYMECVITVNRKTSRQATLQRCHPVNENINGVNAPVSVNDEENEGEETDEETREYKPKKKKKRSGKPVGRLPKTKVEHELENGKDDEEESLDDNQLPEDVKITINPPSPDDSDECPSSPGSDNSGDTIVDGPPNNENAVNEEEPVSPDADDVTKQNSPMDSGDVEDMDGNQEDKADSTRPSDSEDEGADNGEEKAKDIMTDILREPCCLSTDIYLPVPNTEICTFDSNLDAEGANKQDTAGSEDTQKLHSPGKDLP